MCNLGFFFFFFPLMCPWLVLACFRGLFGLFRHWPIECYSAIGFEFGTPNDISFFKNFKIIRKFNKILVKLNF